MLRRFDLKFGVLVGILVAAGCAPSNVYLSNKFISARKVAILPMSNETTDLDGPIFVRQLIQEQLFNRSFQVLPLTDIDAHLKEQGFTDGGQLRAATPQQLGQWTGADTLFYSTLEDFNYINVGFYWQRKVKITAKLVDAATGERLWEAERDYSTRLIVGSQDEAKRQFAIQLAAKAAEKLTHRPLQTESRFAVARLLSALPNRN